MKEKVSIVIPCYNGEKFIDKCFTALLNQTYKNLEIIVVDDGSKDKTAKILRSYLSRFKKRGMELIIKKSGKSGGGPSHAFQVGLKAVTGEYLYWQDIDDYVEKDTIENLLQTLKEHKDCQVARGACNYRTREDVDTIIECRRSTNPTNKDVFNNLFYEEDEICFVGIYMVRMKHFDERNPNRELYDSRLGQNYQLLLPVLYHAKCAYIDKPVYNYIISKNSLSNSITGKKEKLKSWKIYENTILNTLKNIKVMSKEDYKFYKKEAHKKYKNRKKEYLSYLKKQKEPLLPKIKSKIKRIIKRIIKK